MRPSPLGRQSLAGACLCLLVAACTGNGAPIALLDVASPPPAAASAGSQQQPATSTPATSAAPINAQNANAVPLPAAPSTFLVGPYKDVSVALDGASNVLSTAVTGSRAAATSVLPAQAVTSWAFATGECGQESWAGVTADKLAQANVQAWAGQNKRYILSTGGAGGVFTCATDAGFRAFVNRFRSSSLIGVDFDIEAGQSAADVQNLVARVKAAASDPSLPSLRYSFTIATVAGSNGESLADAGEQVVKALNAANVNTAFINLMVMDYGSASPNICVVRADGSCDMGASAVQAAKNVHTKYGISYSNMELTPMIGQNDIAGETFVKADVATVMAFAKAQNLAGVHFWSLDRDQDCVQTAASPTCNGVGGMGALGYLQAFLDLTLPLVTSLTLH